MAMNDESVEPAEGFEPVEKGHTRQTGEFVSVSPQTDSRHGAYMRMSATVHRFLDEPEAIRFFYNATSDELAFAPAVEGDEDAYSASKQKVAASMILQHAGINTENLDSRYRIEDVTLDGERNIVVLGLSGLREELQDE